MKVITKIAITTVPMSDCREPTKSEPKLLPTFRAETSAGCDVGDGDGKGATVGSLEAATSTGGSTGLGKGAGSGCETVGWFKEYMTPTYPTPARAVPSSRSYPSAVMPGRSAIAAQHLVQQFSWSSPARVPQIPDCGRGTAGGPPR